MTISTRKEQGTNSSRAFIGPGLDGLFSEYLKRFRKTLLIVGEGLYRARRDLVDRYAAGESGCIVFHIQDGEEAKSFSSYMRVISEAAESGIGRNDLIAYIGGGTVGDVSGFAASTYLRGVPLCAIPTTLLSQVDSSIGGKNGINVSGIKNVAGTFYSPDRILCDTDFIAGMDTLALRDSLSEVLKYGVTLDVKILQILEKHSEPGSLIGQDGEDLVTRSVKAKKAVVEQDPYESRGIRQALNAGHTVAHAIEGATSNSISHGRAVLIGLMAEAFVSDRITGHSSGVLGSLKGIADRYSMDYHIPEGLSIESVMAFAEKDKKIEGGMIAFPVMVSPGKVEVRTLDKVKIMGLIEEWLRNRA